MKNVHYVVQIRLYGEILKVGPRQTIQKAKILFFLYDVVGDAGWRKLANGKEQNILENILYNRLLVCC